MVQLRDKSLDARPLLARARAAATACRSSGVPFLLNDRPDLALACEADGVHLGQDDAPVSLARRILGRDAIIGLSTHASPELVGALAEPVDYVSVGPVVATPTKPGRAGTGLGYLAEARRRIDGDGHAGTAPGLPWFVTGGVTPGTVTPLIEAGARRFVVVRYLTEAADPQLAAHRLVEAIEGAIAAIEGSAIEGARGSMGAGSTRERATGA